MPLRLGGGKPVTEAIFDSLNAQFGTGYDTKTVGNIVYIRNLALAKAIASAWVFNKCIANQGNPLKLSVFLDRQEEMRGLPSDPSLNDNQRRQRVLDLISRTGEDADYQFISDRLRSILGPVFGALEFVPLTSALIHSPDPSYPFGTQVPGYPWYSTVCHILVYTVQPSNWSEGQYRAAIGPAKAFLDAVLPAWLTYTLYRAPAVGTPISVPGGPSHAGFYLDNQHNIDSSIFGH